MKLSNKGFSLTEVLVSLTIIMILSSGIFHSLLSNLKFTRDSFYKTQAIQLAQEQLDHFRMLDPSTLSNSGVETVNKSIGDREFELVASFCENPSFCSANTRHIKITVYYKDKKKYEVETVYTKLR